MQSFQAASWCLTLLVLVAAATADEPHGDCYASVGGAGGHVYQFDGGRVDVNPVANGCRRPLLLTKARHSSPVCADFAILASFEEPAGGGRKAPSGHRHRRHRLSRLSGVTVKVDDHEYSLLTGRRLKVNGHEKPTPYSHGDAGVRIFRSGEDLVLAHKGCHFWVAYDGKWTATYRLGSDHRGHVIGLAGDCDGQHDDGGDKPARWLAAAGCSQSHHGHGHRRRSWCRSASERHSAAAACKRVITGHGACPSLDVLHPCIEDLCAVGGFGHRYHSSLGEKVACANFYLHSRRCAGHHKPLAWRHRSGCQPKCGRNQHYARKANPCPRTCDNLFFGAPKRCFKLPMAEGCQCNRGFVHDDNNKRCVRPRQCSCLAKLCVDRMPRHKCRRWRAQGRCRRYPSVMGRLCRLTCGHCRPRCRNQLGAHLCQRFRRQGKCRKRFYRTVCRATCVPSKCRCPSSRVVRSKCSPRFKNRSVTSLRWFPGEDGKCKKSVLVHFEPCGSCRRKVKTVMKPCNYCTGQRLGERISQHRERHGKRRCLRRVSRVHRKCSCPPRGHAKVVKFTRCKGHSVRVHVLKVFKPAKHCTACVRVTRRTVMKRIKCPGRRVVNGKCSTPGQKYRIRREYRQVARNCACRSRLHSRRKLACRCRPSRSRTACRGGGRHLVTVTTGWRLKRGRCVRWQRRVKRKSPACPKRRLRWVVCNRASCTAVRHTAEFHVLRCRCVKRTVKKRLGKCCCPHGYKRTVRVNRYWKKSIHVKFILKKHRCRRRVTTRKIRVACPGPRRKTRCDKTTGNKVFTRVWYAMKNGGCVRQRSVRVAKINCCRNFKRLAGPCSLHVGAARYRKVEFHFYRRRRNSCQCTRVRQTVKELCGCRHGHFVETSRCPKVGCNGKACGSGCFYTKTYFYFARRAPHHEDDEEEEEKSGKHHGCHKKVFKQMKFPCCCSPKRHTRRWCRSGKFAMRQVTYWALRKSKLPGGGHGGGHQCHKLRRTVRARIRCRRHDGHRGTVTKKLPHRKPNHYYLATYRWRVRKCRCQAKVVKRVCLKRCRSGKRRRYCDRLKRQWVTRRVTWHLRGCRTCVQRVKERRVPARCSKLVKRLRHCHRRTGVLTLTTVSWRPHGCGCVKRRRVRRMRCKCPKPVVGRPHCDRKRHAFVKRTTYWVLKAGRCVKRRRTEARRVRCGHSVLYKRVCKAKTGVKTVYIGALHLRGCHCVRLWDLHKRLRCNCKLENRHRRTRRYCDRHRNLKVTVTYHYVLRRGRCVRRSLKRYRAYRCPKPYTRRHRCDQKRRVQLTVTRYTVKRKCACVRAVKRHRRKCGCPGRKVERRRFCKKALGLVVTVIVSRRWSDRKFQCIKRAVRRSHRVLCSRKTKYSVTKCFKNKFYVETKVFHVRKGCRCVKRRVKHRRNCHCKSIVRHYKCPKRGFGYTRRVVRQIRRWDAAHKRCRTVRYVTRRIRCRCPRPQKRRYCRHGDWITETTRFALRHGSCHKRRVREHRSVHCRKVVRRRYTACKSGCKKRVIYTMVQRLHPKRCACYYAVVKRRVCPCCCQKSKTIRRCVKGGTAWQRVTVGWKVLRGKRCGCKRWRRRRTYPVHCTKRRRLSWQKCNKHSCLSRQRVSFYVARGCRCHRVSKFTGKRRVCCCRGKPSRKRFCRNSAVYEKLVTKHLKRWRCVRRTRVHLLRLWRCRARPRTVIGECDHHTCLQPIHTLVSRVDRPRCRCRRVAIKHHHRPCCCLKEPKHLRHCDSTAGAWVSTEVNYSFDEDRLACVSHRESTRRRVRCPPAHRAVSSCNRRTCRREVKHVSHFVRKCRCQRRIRVSHHVCCCPRAKHLPRRCVRHRHQWVKRRVSWRLSHGRCVKSVTTTKKRVTCRHKHDYTHHLPCNRHSCRRKIRHTTWRLKGCRCVRHRRTTLRTCCCRPAKRSTTKCVRHRDLIRYTTLRFLDKRRFRCRSRTVKKLLHRLRRCRSYEHHSHCNPKTRHRTIKRVLRRPRHCRCRFYRRVVRRILCSCPKTRVKRTKCNKASCHRSITKVWFTSHGKGYHFKCRKHRLTIRLRCCCKRKPSKRIFCDRRSGAIKREDKWTVFVARSRSCRRKRKLTVVKRLVCRKTVCRVSKCNKHTGYKVKVCTSFRPLRRKCNCIRRIARRRIVCHCPPSHTRSYCKGHSHRVRVRTSWRLSLRRNRCVKRIKRTVKHLACSRRRWRVKKCLHRRHSNKAKYCSGTVQYHRYRIRNCRCKRVTQTRHIKCCCPKRTRVKRCLGDQWLTVFTKYRLRSGHCSKIVRRRRVTIACRRYRVHVSKCAKDCRKRRVVLRYHVRKCKCSLAKRIVRTKRCCCPKPKHYKRCDAAKGIVKRVKLFWRLSNGKCLKRRRIVSRRVICHGGWSHVFKCNKHTRKQKVVLVRYHRVGCRCRRYRRVRRLLCRCRRPMVIKEKCIPKRWKRRVFKISYTMRHRHSKKARCQKHRRVWYSEPCRCPKPTKRKFCSRSGKTVVTVARRWKLVTVKRQLDHHGHHWRRLRECVRKTTVQHRQIKCSGRSVRWSKCVGCKKRRTSVTHRVKRCKCHKRTVVRVFACNCGKKSFRRRRCDKKAGQLVYTRRSCYARRNAHKCSCSTRHWRRKVHCPRRHRRVRLTKKKCGLLRRNGWHTRYSIEWTRRRGCGCVRRRRTVIRLCHCRRGHRRVWCALDGKTVVRTRVFYRPGKKGHSVGCRRIRRVSRRKVLCRGHHGGRPKVHFGGCNKHCKRSVSVSQCYVKRCRRRRYHGSGLQRCCVPKPKRKHYCDRKAGKWVTVVVTYRLVPSGPLLKDRHDHVLVVQKKVVSRTRRMYRSVHCPRSHVREHCHRQTGRWRKTRVSWHRVGCHCRRRVVRSHGKCKCPPKRVHWGPCRHRHRVKTVIRFKLHGHTCRRSVRRRTYLCACPKPRRYTVCDRRGSWKTCRVSYRLRFRQQRCQKRRVCHRRRHTCPESEETHDDCMDHHRHIQVESWHLNKRKCACVRRVRSRIVECDCHLKGHKSTKCQHGAYVTRIVTFHQRGERCAKAVKTVSHPVYCSRRHIKRVVRGSCVTKAGHPHRGYQKVMRQHYRLHGCKCIRRRVFRWVPCICRLIKRYRTRKFTRCHHGSTVVHTKVYYVLRRGFKCVKRVHRRRHHVVCKGVKKRRSHCKRNHRGDTYSTKRVWRRHSNGHCGCKWHLAHVSKRVCHCRPSHTLKRCVRHKIHRTIRVHYVPVHGKHYCHGRRHFKDERLACPKGFTRRGKCHKCAFPVRRYAYRLVKCRCVARLLHHRRLRCCCPRPVTKRHCDVKRHLWVSVTIKFRLSHHRCHRRRVVRSHRVHCGRRRPHYRVTKCHKGFRLIRKSVRYNAGCSCRVRTTVHKQRCACPHNLIYRRGKCGHRFAHDIWLGYHLKNTGHKIPGTNKPVMKCVRSVVDRLKRRCRCPKPYRRTICKADRRLLRITVRYRLHDDSCQRRRTVSERRLPCHRKPRLLHVTVVPVKCNAKHRYVQTVRKVYHLAKHCKCRRFVKVTRRVCDCLRKYGKRQRVKCVGSNRLIKRVVWMVKRGHGCVKRVRTSIKVLHCAAKRRIRRGKCKRSSGLRHFQIFHLVPHRCRCVWRLIRRAKAPCQCRHSTRVTRCLGNSRWVTIKRFWRLSGHGLAAHCVAHRRRIVHRVKCRVGRKVRRSHRCHHNNYRYTHVTVTHVRKCRCMKRTERHKCRCRCPKPRVKRVCRHDVWVTRRLEHTLAKCSCRATRQVVRDPVTCPEWTRIRGHCRRGHNGDKYRQLVLTSWKVHKCRCHRRRQIRRRLCGCDLRRRKRSGCLSGFIKVSVVSERHVIDGRCRRVRVHRKSVRVHCGREKVRRVCDHETGQLSILVVKPYVKRCRCYRRVVRHTGSCGCHKGRKLIGVGKCNRHTCRQRLLFKEQGTDPETNECTWRRFHSHRVCCCHGTRRTVKCLRKTGYHLTTHVKMILRHWNCLKHVTEVSRRVKCKRNVVKRSIRLKGGFLKLVKCWTVRRACDCVKRCRTVIRRYRCKKPVKRSNCHCSGGQCRHVTHLTHWRLARGRCHEQTRSHVRPTVCPPDFVVLSRCNWPTKYGFYYTRLETGWRQRACRCRRVSHLSRVTCRCWKSRVIRRCHRRRGVTFTLKLSYRLRRGRCVKSVLRKSHKIRCRHGWRFDHRTASDKHGRYFRVHVQLVRVGCHCEKRYKRVPCRSRCRPCVHTKRCSAHRHVVSTRTCWHLRGCRCVRRVRTRRHAIHCPKSYRRSRCHRKRGCALTVVTKRYRVHHCRCLATTRVSKRRRCCCPKPRKTRACIKGSVRTRVIRHRLSHGQCHSSFSDTHRPVNCPRRRRRAIRGPCHHGKQRYSLHYWMKRGCQCVRRVRMHYRRCACEYKVVELIVAVDLHAKHGHADRVDYRSGVARFLETVLLHFKYASARVKTIVFTYSSGAVNQHRGPLHHGLEHHHKAEDDVDEQFMDYADFTNGKTDLHGALKAISWRLKRPSKAKRIVIVVTRGNHGRHRRSIALAEKIQRRARVFVVGFGKMPKSGRYVKWLASKPRRLHYMHLGVRNKYHFSATRIFERACRHHCSKRPRRHIGACHRTTCRRLVSRVHWLRDRHTGKCLRRRRVSSRPCCCRKRHSVNHVVCRHGRLLRLVTRHRFDSHRLVCVRRVHRIDVSATLYARCRQTPPHGIRHRGICGHDGWRRDTVVTRRVNRHTCRCRTTRRHLRRVRCRCPPSRSQRICRREIRHNHHSGHVRHRWSHVDCRVSYKLSHGRCIKRRHCRSRKVVCRHGRRAHRGRCHRHSCRRRHGLVWYSVDGKRCRCRRRVKSWTEVCCCKRRSTQYSFCDKRRHKRVRVHYWYRLHSGACRRVVRRVERPVGCPTGRRLKLGPCRPRGHLGYYRRVTQLSWRPVGCRCARRTRHIGHRLCRCRRHRRTKTQCHREKGLLVTRRSSLKAAGNRCRWHTRVVRRVRVTCSARKVVRRGHCSGHGKGGKSKDGRKFAVVTITCQRRVGCKCRTVRRRHTQLCACSHRVRRVTRCHRNRWLQVSVFRYRLSRRHHHRASCQLIRKTHRHRVTCHRPLVHLSKKCHKGKRAVYVTVHRPRGCRCTSKVYHRLVRCKSHCNDLLPSRVCHKWAASSGVRLCHRHPHLARRLCARTCRLCCRKTSLIYSGKRCLTRQRPGVLPHHSHGLILARKTSFEACTHACGTNRLCRAFDYHRASGKCRLLRVNRQALHLRQAKSLRHTPGCLLFEKACSRGGQHRRRRCAFRRVVKNLPCRCRKLFGKHRRPLCYRHAHIAVYHYSRRHHARGGCRRRVIRVRVPCRRCEDAKRWCHQAAREGKCSKSRKVRRLCRHSCHQCKRHRTTHALHHRRRRVGRCSRHGWRRVVRGGLWYDGRLQLWRVRLAVERRRCVRCPAGTRLIIGRCTRGGKRHLKWVTVKRLGKKGHCKTHVRRRVYDCRGCGGLDLARSVGRCVHAPGGHGWRRKVTTRFTVRSRKQSHHHHGRCVIRRHAELAACSPKCPKRRVTRGRCVCGKRIVCTRYYVTYPGTRGAERHRCVPRKYTRSEACVSSAKACVDKLRLADCSAVRRKGMCKTLRSLCAKTCGLCKL